MSNFIPKEALDELSVWAVPDVGSAAKKKRMPGEPKRYELTQEEIDKLKAIAQKKGFDSGYQSGYASGESEVKQVITHLEQIIAQMQTPLAALDERTETALVDLSLAIARKVILTELAIDPNKITEIFKQCLQVLPIVHNDITVKCHPDDEAIIRQSLAAQPTSTQFHLQAEPDLQRGGCYVTTDNSEVDGTLEKRMEEAFASLQPHASSDMPQSSDEE